jgi:hypothetical protein
MINDPGDAAHSMALRQSTKLKQKKIRIESNSNFSISEDAKNRP